MKVVLASSNKGKIREFHALLSPFDIEIIAQSDLGVEEIEETGFTFIENALLKARHASRVTGLPALADDSGIAVAALKGAPGIYSARYAGLNAEPKDNIKKLLADMKQVPDHQRQASFHCVLAYLAHENDPTPIVCDGIWDGLVLQQPSPMDGFGYDPIFYVPSEKKAASELPLDLKNQLSHRGKALHLLMEKLADKK